MKKLARVWCRSDSAVLQTAGIHIKPAFVVLCLLAGLLAWGCGRRATTPQGSLSDFTASFIPRMERWIARYAVPGACVALIEDSQLVWSEAFGVADVESGEPMTLDSVFRVESISKSVTAWGVLRLAEQGLLDLDAPIQDDFPVWGFRGLPSTKEGSPSDGCSATAQECRSE